tara:strand:+ start:5459 stop:6775 length:1317 start_codon:yes stop_codon:yes gene_type:complete
MKNDNSLSLNQGQEEAANAVFQFLFSADKEFSVSGPAGTGKTTLMKHIVDHTLKEYQDSCTLLGKRYIDYELVLCATTNKAAEVLAQSTGLETKTIHSFMNLKVFDDFKTGESKVSRTNSWTVHNNSLIFIDEASMIDSKLYEHIIQGTDNTCKIVYLGDHCQMNPVMEDISPVYRKPKHSAILTEPMRNAGQPALIALCDALRHTVETQEFFQITAVPGVIDYLPPAQAEQFIDSTFNEEESGARVLVYSNNRAKEYLEYIRNLRGYPDLFSVGERLISNSSLQFGKIHFRVEEEFVVESIVKQPYDLAFNTADKNATLQVYEASIKSVRSKSSFTMIIPVDMDHYKALMKFYAKQKNWTVFYHLKNNYPDLRQKDAATVYKAQGSSYDTVFLDLNNIGKCTDSDQLARMLYVGASRAKSRLVLFGELPQRLFSKAA